MKKGINIMIYSLFITLTLFLDYELIFRNISSITNPFKASLMTIALVFILLVFVLGKIKKTKLHYTKNVLVILFSIFMVIGNSYQKIDSWDLVFGNTVMILLSAISFIGYFILFKNMFYVIDGLVDSTKKSSKIKFTKLKKLACFIDDKPFISSLIILFLFWLIYVIAFYPVILSPDPSFQIIQFFNIPNKYADYVIRPIQSVYMTNHHPVMHTILLGGFIEFGRLFGNDNFGLFMYSIMQTVVLASVLAYSIKFLKKNGVSSKWRLIVLGIYALVPMFPFYAMSGVKDTLYTSFIIIYIMFIFNFIKNKKDEKLNFKEMAFILIDILLITLFRNNGIYVIMLSFPLLIFLSKKNALKITAIFLLTISTYGCYTKVVLPHFGIADGSVREALSIPFQQTARYVKENEKDLSKNDKKVIDKVIGYDDLKERYKPRISDPVKNNYNKYATDKDLNNYFEVWFDGLKKHPGTYVDATLNNIYGYFYPNDTNWYIYNKYNDTITKDNLVDYHYNKLSGLRRVLSGYGITFPFIPIFGLLSNIGFNTWILLILLAYLIERKKVKYLVFLLPSLVSLLICVASPVNTYFRYAMPYIFAMPMMFALVWQLLKGCNDERK